MTIRVSIDGQSRAPEDAHISVFDRGFLYGDSVFETVRTYGGEPYALDEHLRRLADSASRVEIELPVSLAQLAAEARALVLEAQNPESYLRIVVTRGAGQLGLPPELAGAPTRVIIVTPLSPPPPEKYERGIRVVTVRTNRATDAAPGAAGAKVGNYLAAVLAMKQARAAAADEALILDADGKVVEGATSNLFLVQAGRLVTPPLESGILPGITRAGVLQVAEGVLGPGCVELRAPHVHELTRADELFISSSVRELLAITHVDGVPIGAAQPGPVYRQLLAAFREHVRHRMSPG